MDTRTTINKRSFDLLRISEDEALGLCVLVNQQDEAIRETLSLSNTDIAHGLLTLDDAVAICCNLRDTIIAMVDGTE